MTVSYSREVASAKVGTFLRLLFRWRGSIYKLMFREMLIYLFFYYSICLLYQFAFNREWQKKFEHWSKTCLHYTNFVPLTFVLGFYVSFIVGRWTNVFKSITWPDRFCLMVQSLMHGQDERSRLLRRTAARYVNLAQILVLRDISSVVRKRFPTLEKLVETGIMTQDELNEYSKIDNAPVGQKIHSFWIPLQWTCSVLTMARKEGMIDADPTLVKIIEEVLSIRNGLMSLICFDWITVPLVYTQVVTIAVYSYFLACIFGRQNLIEHSDSPVLNSGEQFDEAMQGKNDYYFPLFTVLQFVFYMGWLKVAESIMNPLGDDDDDFDVNYIIDRNIHVSFIMVDENCLKIPPITPDNLKDYPDSNLPHTQESAGLKAQPYVPSAVVEPIPEENVDLRSCRQSGNSLLARRFGSHQKISLDSLSCKATANGASGAAIRRLASVASMIRKLSTRRPSATTPPIVNNTDQFLPPPSPGSLDRWGGVENCRKMSGQDLGIYMRPFGEDGDALSIISQPQIATTVQKHLLQPVSEAINEDPENNCPTPMSSNHLSTSASLQNFSKINNFGECDPIDLSKRRKTNSSLIFIDRSTDDFGASMPLLSFLNEKSSDEKL